MIIYEAECKAAEIIADAKNSSSAAGSSYNNMRSSLISKVTALSEQLSSFRDAVAKFGEDSVGSLSECEDMLKKAENVLNEGGAPEVGEPERVAPEYPERPDRTARLDAEDAQKRRDGLDKLRQMADSISGNKEKTPEAEAPKTENKKPEDNSGSGKNKSGKIDLAALSKQANALKQK